MLHTKFQAPEQSSSEEEDFEVYFIFEPKTPVWSGSALFAQTYLSQYLELLRYFNFFDKLEVR